MTRSLPVAGVVGPINSMEAVMVAPLLSLFRIPVLATYASLDSLSDKSRFVKSTLCSTVY